MLDSFRRWLHQPAADEIGTLRGDLAAIFKTEADRKQRKVVALEFAQLLLEECQDWSRPVQVRFVQTPSGEWTMQTRSLQGAFEQVVADLAVRQ